MDVRRSMEVSYTKEKRAFLIELTELSRKHNIVITGCGCCGSPNVVERDCSNLEAGYGSGTCDVQWLAPGDYDWEAHKGTVVRP